MVTTKAREVYIMGSKTILCYGSQSRNPWDCVYGVQFIHPGKPTSWFAMREDRQNSFFSPHKNSIQNFFETTFFLEIFQCKKMTYLWHCCILLVQARACYFDWLTPVLFETIYVRQVRDIKTELELAIRTKHLIKRSKHKTLRITH